jgi:hypothetical protein
MSKRSKWRNTPEGKTVRRYTIPPGNQWSWWTIEMMESPAYRALNLSEHRLIARIRIEHAHHGGRDNGKLPVTNRDFHEYGIRFSSIAPSIRAAEALGWIRVTQQGVASSEEEFRIPTHFALTHLETDDEARTVTNDWRKIKTIEEAEDIAKAARKKPHLGRRISKAPKTFSDYRNGIKPCSRNGSDETPFLNPETGALHHSETGALSIYRGGGGGRGGESTKEPARQEVACRYCGEVTDRIAMRELFKGFYVHATCEEEWRTQDAV